MVALQMCLLPEEGRLAGRDAAVAIREPQSSSPSCELPPRQHTPTAPYISCMCLLLPCYNNVMYRRYGVSSEVHSLSDSSLPCRVVGSDHQVLLCDRQGFATKRRVAAFLHCETVNAVRGIVGVCICGSSHLTRQPLLHRLPMWVHPHQPEFLPWHVGAPCCCTVNG